MLIYRKNVFKGWDSGITTWDEPKVRRYQGKRVMGRPTRGFGDKPFKYAGKEYNPEPWTQLMRHMKLVAEALVATELKRKIQFNFCLCGYYGEEGRGIPHHSDTVPTFDDLVVSISLGSPRVFQWIEYTRDIKEHSNTSEVKTSYNPKKKTTNYLMEDGDVFIFDGLSQMSSTHAVLSMEGCGERTNLTFRSGI